MPCLHLLISGRVQGVWFRESMRQEAQKRGATGWVRNLADGRVEATVCGDAAIIDKMLEWARRGPPMARVTGVETEQIPDLAFTGFEKKP